MSRIRDLLGLSHVPRWTTHPVARPQFVSDHSYRVVVIVREICYLLSLSIADTLDAINWAINHDAPETKLSDMPGPVHELIESAFGVGSMFKLESMACPWLNKSEIGAQTRMIVKIADIIEAISWVHTYGNGLKDKFDEQDIEEKLRDRLQDTLLVCSNPNLVKVARGIMRTIEL